MQVEFLNLDWSCWIIDDSDKDAVAKAIENGEINTPEDLCAKFKKVWFNDENQPDPAYLTPSMNGGKPTVKLVVDSSKELATNVPLETIYYKVDREIEPVGDDGHMLTGFKDIFAYEINGKTLRLIAEINIRNDVSSVEALETEIHNGGNHNQYKFEEL